MSPGTSCTAQHSTESWRIIQLHITKQSQVVCCKQRAQKQRSVDLLLLLLLTCQWWTRFLLP
jgi:hypothetical protein